MNVYGVDTVSVYKKIETILANKIKRDISEGTALLKNYADVSAKNLSVKIAHKVSYQIKQQGSSTSYHFVILDNQKKKAYEFRRKGIFVSNYLVLNSDGKCLSSMRIKSCGNIFSSVISSVIMRTDTEIGRVEYNRRRTNSHFSTTIDGWRIENTTCHFVLYFEEKAVCTFTDYPILNNSILIAAPQYTDIIMIICAAILNINVYVRQNEKYSAGGGGG